jgi:hypothetical protein
MKLVKEHIDEKFAEDSDPIRDMGIGIITKAELYKLVATLKQKIQEIFPHETIELRILTGANIYFYEIQIEFVETGSYVWDIYFVAKKDLNIGGILQDMGWHITVTTKDTFINTYDLDTLIPAIFKKAIKTKKFAQQRIEELTIRLERLKRQENQVEKTIETTKIMQSYLK